MANELLSKRDNLIQTCKEIVIDVLSTDRMELRLKFLQEQSKKLYDMLTTQVREHGRNPDDTNEERQQFEDDCKTHEELQKKIEKLKSDVINVHCRRFDAERFIVSLSQMDAPVLDFDEMLWISLVDVAVTPENGEQTLEFRLRNGGATAGS